MPKARHIKGTAARQLPLGVTELNPSRELWEPCKKCTPKLAYRTREGAGVCIHQISKSFLQGCSRWFNFWVFLASPLRCQSELQEPEKAPGKEQQVMGSQGTGTQASICCPTTGIVIPSPAKGSSLGFSISFIPDRQVP